MFRFNADQTVTVRLLGAGLCIDGRMMRELKVAW